MADGTVAVDPSNQAMFEAWDGGDGEGWAADAARFDRSVVPYHERLIAACGVTDGDSAIDVGCGNGLTTIDVAAATPSGRVLGVDLSHQMLAVAAQRAAAGGLTNVVLRQGDAQVHPFEAASADLVLSRFGAMFFGDRDAAFANLARALRPGGRLALLTWQALADNEWMTEMRRALAAGRDLPAPPPEAPSPFGLSDPESVRHLLERAGFEDVRFEDLRFPLWFGEDADDADAFLGRQGFTRFLLADLDQTERQAALAALRALVEDHTSADGVQLGSAAWLITARRAAPMP